MASKHPADMRSALIEAAAQLIASEGSAALTLRRVAEVVGTSTMAVYTHFGGMPELRRALRREGFARLAEYLAAVEQSDDPVTDLILLGRAYYDNATENEALYRAMFLEQPLDDSEGAIGYDSTFGVLRTAIERCLAAGRFPHADPTEIATELWGLEHGVVALRLARLLSERQALSCLEGAARRLFSSYGDEPEAAARSFRTARARAGSVGKS